MEDERNNTTGETSSHSLPNNITARSVERTTTQYLPIPSALRKERSDQFIKITRKIDLSKMTNSNEELPQYRDQLEEEIKDVFIWAISAHGDEDG